MTIQDGIHLLVDYKSGSSLTPILDFIYQIYESEGKPNQSWAQPGLTSKNPDTLIGLLLFVGSVIEKRKEVTVLYEKCLEKYQEFTHMLVGKSRLTDDEAKLKETLTEYILDVEKIFETNDLTDESLVKELSRFAVEMNLSALTEGELQKLVISSKAMILMEPHLEKYKTIHSNYAKMVSPLERLIRISDLIMEELAKKPTH